MFKYLLENSVSATTPVTQAQGISAEAVTPPITHLVPHLMPSESHVEEDAMTDTGRTDNDDPVGDAFRTVLNAEEHSEGDELDDELEVVVYPRYDGELFYFYASDVFLGLPRRRRVFLSACRRRLYWHQA
jgi:hypothetical protein